ncbi:HSP90 family protein [Paenalcaligenes suwonensis]|uniref:HSP90 family protein n=1 Tax=Paenalcaligenes suwonensis TaxID=1202713 RepID=UPI00140C669E|nr:HSP90 family protein [Paenalcaligenes suwonensis]NHC61926.1 HSP90 family protein [Paenalcaligenes suwonensis]
MNQESRFQVNLAGMIDILSNHLYSDQNVYIRELLQNGTDAIRARKLWDSAFEAGEINVELQQDQVSNHKTLVFSDNGIGLTANEIEIFLATIASSSKGEKNFGASNEQSFIGRFGIGLLSCFVVTTQIRLITHSAKTGTVLEWNGKGDGTYDIHELSQEARPEVGTTVYLTYKAEIAAESFAELHRTIRECLFQYGACLEVPIYLQDQRARLWINEHSNKVGSLADLQALNPNEILQFGRLLFGADDMRSLQDYFILHNESGDTFAVAYVIPFAVSTHARKLHRAYLNRMFVSDAIEEVMPEWAFFTRTVIWTKELQPVASREAFYQNEALDRVSQELGASLKQKIKAMPEKQLQRLLNTHYLAFKALACEDSELLQFIYPHLNFRTLNGEENLQTLLSRSEVVYYTQSVDEFRQIADVARAQQMPLINGGYAYDSSILRHLNSILGHDVFKLFQAEDVEFAFQPLFPEEERAFSDLLAGLNERMKAYQLEVVLNYFSPHDIPMLYICSQKNQAERELGRVAEASNDLFGGILGSLQEDKNEPLAQLYLNFHNEVVQSVFCSGRSVETITSVIEVLYVQALLMGHYPLKKDEIALMNKGLLHIIKAMK